MIVNKTGTHLGTAPHLVQIFRQPQTRPNPLDEVQPADLAHMIRQPRLLENASTRPPIVTAFRHQRPLPSATAGTVLSLPACPRLS